MASPPPVHDGEAGLAERSPLVALREGGIDQVEIYAAKTRLRGDLGHLVSAHARLDKLLLEASDHLVTLAELLLEHFACCDVLLLHGLIAGGALKTLDLLTSGGVVLGRIHGSVPFD